MNFDISPLLDGWEYRPGEISVRKFKAKDGSEKIQLRVDLGLLQMNAMGRPDGKRPFGHESLLQHYEAKLAKYLAEREGQSEGFRLTAEDCSKLLQEAIQYHHRYICLFQLRDYESVIRDTQRNLKVFDFVDEFAASDDMSWSLQQFCPQLLMMETRARGSMALEKKDVAGAIDAVNQGLEAIRQFYRDFARAENGEQSGEIQSLEAWLKELQNKAASRRPRRSLSAREKLEHALNEAVRREDYEQAAKYRDSLRNLKTSQER
jgi:hypothetical protein